MKLDVCISLKLCLDFVIIVTINVCLMSRTGRKVSFQVEQKPYKKAEYI